MKNTTTQKGKGAPKKEENKFLSRKWLMGMGSWVAGIVFAILDYNDILAVPIYVIVMLLLIALTWLVTEGYLDKRSFELLERIGLMKKK